MMTRENLTKLRSEITLGSIFYADYENSFGISKEDCLNFFDGYSDYLYEIACEENNGEKWCEYDNIDNLEAWYWCFENEPLPVTEEPNINFGKSLQELIDEYNKKWAA